MTMRNCLYDLYWDELLKSTGNTGRLKNRFFTDFFQELCIYLNAKLILEIGAHGAEFSREMAKRLPDTKVIAFEANPYVYERFAREIPEGVDYRNCLVASDDRERALIIPRKITAGTGELNLSRSNTTSSLRGRVGNVENDEVVCSSTTVDAIYKDMAWPTPCALWIDVEGAVGEVLFGATQSLKKNISILLVEVEKLSAWEGQWIAEDVRAYLAAHSFIPLMRDRETEWQFNEIYIREDLFDASIAESIRLHIDTLISNCRNDA